MIAPSNTFIATWLAEERPRWPALPTVEELARSVLSLPVHPHLECDLDAVSDALLETLDVES